MLVLGVGSLGAESAAWQRIAETLVGAAVGIAANLLFPPKVASADAGRAIDGLADSVSELLGRAADELAELVADGRDAGAGRRSVAGRGAPHHPRDIPRVGAALAARRAGAPAQRPRRRYAPTWGRGCARASRRWSTPRSRSAGCSAPWSDATHDDATWLDDESAEDVLLGLAQTFRELAAGVDAFGQLVRDEADAASA